MGQVKEIGFVRINTVQLRIWFCNLLLDILVTYCSLPYTSFYLFYGYVYVYRR